MEELAAHPCIMPMGRKTTMVVKVEATMDPSTSSAPLMTFSSKLRSPACFEGSCR